MRATNGTQLAVRGAGWLRRGLPSRPARALSAAAPSASTTSVAKTSVTLSQVHVTFSDNHVSAYHHSWLRHHCPCAKCTQLSSGQRLASRPPARSVERAEVSPQGKLTIRFDDTHVAEFDAGWLKRHCYAPSTLAKERSELLALGAPCAVHKVSYGLLRNRSPQVLLDWMRGFVSRGVCLIQDLPASDSGLLELVALTGCEPSHALYGSTFKVETTENPINVAYSTEALEPHQDLAYYESPPGVQLLHCQDFDRSIQGGESTFVDGHAAAELLRLRDRRAFDVLCQIPATFQKDHVRRANPAKMFFQRPHICATKAGDVLAVFWAPPFEGPLRVDSELVESYYSAREAFDCVLKDPVLWEKHGFKFRLEPGQAVMFNNRRFLHGREAFTPGRRKLHGCYLDLDTFMNKYRVLQANVEGVDQAQTGWGLSAPHEPRMGLMSSR
jgi:gamma-butyrobetaine dioxygenase